MNDLNPWAGVSQAPQDERTENPNVDRRRPQEERALRSAEVLAGLRGDKKDHAVTFADLERFSQALIKTIIPREIPASSGQVSSEIEAQFAAINTESQALVDAFNDLFEKASEDIGLLGAEVDADFNSFETIYDGEIARIDQLIASIDGGTVTWAIRADNNGRISGLIFTADNTESDFVVIDSTFRIVNTSGQGNLTPFIVYPTSRNVSGTIVPAGVYAENLFVTMANIAQLRVDTAHIADAAITFAKIGTAEVGTLKIEGNAVTIPVSGQSGNIIGNGSYQSMVNISLNLPFQSDVLLFWSVKQGYASTVPTWGYQLRSSSGLIYDQRSGMVFGADQPSGQSLLLNQAAGSFSAQLRWIGENGNISGIGSLTVLVVQR